MSYFKWVGSKRKKSSYLLSLFPKNFNNYYEQFCGSASLFFALIEKDLNQGINRKYFLADTNKDLINFHLLIRNQYQNLLDLILPYENKDPKEIYEIFKKTHNIEFLGLDYYAAIRFIFLIKRSYGGIWRVNKKNEFNVPFDNTQNSSLLPKDIEYYSNLLKHADIQCHSYSLSSIKENDFCFLDPPYYPVSKTSNFTSYNSGGWKEKDHLMLMEYLKYLNDTKCKFLMTNTDCDFIRENTKNFTYTSYTAINWLKKETVRTHRKECIVTNYDFETIE